MSNFFSQSVKTAFATVLFIFAFLYIFTEVFGPIPFSVNSINTTKSDMFTVSATGEATAVPDTAVTTFGVTKSATTVEAAKDQVTQSVNTIVDGLKDLGVDEKKIKTVDYTVYPDYDYTSGRNTVRGYTVTQNVRVEITPIEVANKAVDMATAAGATNVGGIQFTVAESDKLKLENKARDEAIKKAKTKAGEIAKSAGLKLGKIVNVQDSGNAYQPPVMYDTKMSLEAGNESRQTELQPGENTVKVTVTLSYETL